MQMMWCFCLQIYRTVRKCLKTAINVQVKVFFFLPRWNRCSALWINEWCRFGGTNWNKGWCNKLMRQNKDFTLKDLLRWRLVTHVNSKSLSLMHNLYYFNDKVVSVKRNPLHDFCLPQTQTFLVQMTPEWIEHACMDLISLSIQTMTLTSTWRRDLQPVTSHCPSQPDVPLIDRCVETIASQCDRGGTGMKRRDERSEGTVKRMEKEGWKATKWLKITD